MISNRILPLTAFLVALGIFFAYVQPAWSGTIAETKAAIIANDQALAAANSYAVQQNTLASALNTIDSASLARLNVFLPDSVDNVGLILDLTALASRSGLSLSNIDVTTNITAESASALASGAVPIGHANPVGSIDLSLSAVGTYAALQTFLTGIEKSQRILDVQDIVVKGSDTSVYTYQMKLRLFWLR
ncbi:MAG: GspMb/PilO family protein [Candidatus Kaiserbacteria bacterium]|nr:GspMb/PilO family protein [Candidatus Kaiserbacteria bacterium]